MKFTACRVYLAVLRPFLFIFLFLFVTFFFISCSTEYSGKKRPTASNGILDLRDWDFEKDGPVALSGEWELYWNQLLEGGDEGIGKTILPDGIFKIPRRFGGYQLSNGEELNHIGYATFRLKVILPPKYLEPPKNILKLYSGKAFSASFLTILDEQGSSVSPGIQIGLVGTHEEKTIPLLRKETQLIRNTGELTVLWQVSNFHYPIGGPVASPVLGEDLQIQKRLFQQMSMDFFIMGLLLIFGFYHLVLFIVNPPDRSALWFGITCLQFSLHVFAFGNYLEYQFPHWPNVDTYMAYWKFYLVNLWLAVPVGILFFRSLFPKESHRQTSFILVGVGGFLVLLVSVFPIHSVARQYVKDAFLIYEGIFLIWIVYILIRASLGEKRLQAQVLLVGFACFVIIAVRDLMIDFALIPDTDYWLPIGLVLFIFSQSVSLAINNHQVRKEKYLAQKQIAENLQKVDTLKDEFLANTSHELRTPLAGIIGISQSLLDGTGGTPTPEQEKNLKLITQSGKRLAHLIDDIQDLSRLKNKDLQLNLQPVGLQEVTELILTLCQPLVGKKELHLVNRIPESFPDVVADENRLQQILFNLVGNAIKFTSQGSIEIHAEVEEKQAKVHVVDTGIGIAPDKLDRIFNAFEQADGSISRRHGGTGLGLYLTKQLVELHQGTLAVQSQLDEGSRFTFSLPLQDSELPPLESQAQPIPAALSVVDAEIPLSVHVPAGKEKAHILVVDDDIIVLQVLVNILSQEGYSISTAINGKEALEVLESDGHPLETEIKLVILDVMMPEMNGYEVCRAIRSKFEATDLPVILLTARTRPEDLVIGLKAGANDYLTKPVLKEELIARIENHLELKQSVRRLKENERLRDVIFQKEKVEAESLAKRRHLIRLLDQAGAAQSLPDDDTTLLQEIRHLPETLDGVIDFDQAQNHDDELRQCLVDTMSLSLSYWNQSLNKSKVELAEESQIWNIYFDANGSPRTRTLDRYLKISTLPKKPRWRDVLQTAYYVLKSCPDSSSSLRTELESNVTRLKQLFQ